MPNRFSPGCKCCGEPTPCESANLCILVLRSTDSVPLEGATVVVTRTSDDAVIASGTTDSDGLFCTPIDPEHLGAHTAEVSRFCYLDNGKAFTVVCGSNSETVLLPPDPACLVQCEDECPEGTLFPPVSGRTATLGSGGWGIYNGAVANNIPGGVAATGTFPNLGNDFTSGTPWGVFGGRPVFAFTDSCWTQVTIAFETTSGGPGAYTYIGFCSDGSPPASGTFGGICDAPPVCPSGAGSHVYSLGTRSVTLAWSDPGGGSLMMMAPPPGGEGKDEGGGMATATPRTGVPSGADLLDNAESCPHREAIPDDERTSCGCTHRCAAGRSRRRGGGVLLRECWNCPLAPRRAAEGITGG